MIQNLETNMGRTVAKKNDLPNFPTDKMIIEIERIVENACQSDDNKFGYGGWTHHIVEVVKYSKFLAPLFYADVEIVVIAALLHDYAGIKNIEHYAAHHEKSSQEAEKILSYFCYPKEKTEAVKHCIATHRGSTVQNRSTPEAECLANADAIAHIMQVPSLLKLAYVEYKMEIDSGAVWVKKKLIRSWNKLNPKIQDMFKCQYEASLLVLNASSDTRQFIQNSSHPKQVV
jgi:uncharacterized protein